MSKHSIPTSDLPMMIGTSTGYTYLAFARVGKVVLGIKPNAISSGAAFGNENTTYIGARLRSADISTITKPEGFTYEDEGNVASLFGKGLSDTWPEVEWEKEDESRSSTQIGVFLRGTFTLNSDALFNSVTNKKLANDMRDYLIQLAGGEENLLIPKRKLRDWIDSIYAPQFDTIKKSIEAKQEMSEHIEENIGTFGMQAKLLKSIYDKAKGLDPKAEDAETPDAGDGDDDDNGGYVH